MFWNHLNKAVKERWVFSGFVNTAFTPLEGRKLWKCDSLRLKITEIKVGVFQKLYIWLLAILSWKTQIWLVIFSLSVFHFGLLAKWCTRTFVDLRGLHLVLMCGFKPFSREILLMSLVLHCWCKLHCKVWCLKASELCHCNTDSGKCFQKRPKGDVFPHFRFDLLRFDLLVNGILEERQCPWNVWWNQVIKKSRFIGRKYVV